MVLAALRRVVVAAFGFACVLTANAGVVATGSGYQVTYGIDMTPGTSNGSDITSVFIFESDGSQLSVDHAFTIPGSGISTLSHTIPFAPTSALVAGVGLGVPGVGDGIDHIYMMVNKTFATANIGLKWSEIFPGEGGTRVRHNEFVALLSQAAGGDSGALQAVTAFATGDAAAAWFDPNGGFSMAEFTILLPPVGGNVSEPGTFMLLAAALTALLYLRRVPAVQRRRRI